MLNLERRDLLRATIALAIPSGIVPLLGGCQPSQNASSSDEPSRTSDPDVQAIDRKPMNEEKMMQVQYLEIVTPDVDAVCAQYSKVHGVTFGDPDPNLGGARTAKLMGGGMLGIRGPLRDDEAPVVRPYILVQDIAASVAAAVEAGAETALPPMELPGHGTCAIVVQGGIDFGLWQL